MVSLAPGVGRRQGGVSFGSTSDRESLRSEEVDLLAESEQLLPTVTKVQFTATSMSLVIAVAEAFLLVIFEIMMFVLSQGLHVNILGGQDPPFSFLALLHVSLWFFVMLFHFFLAYQHNQLRLRGYLSFYRQTKNLRHVPPLVLSFGNAILLALFSAMDHSWAGNSFKDYIFIQIVYSLEFVIAFPTLVYYIAKVMSFNKKRALPDAYAVRDDNVRLEAQGEIGYSDAGWPYGILEKQGDMICYLQQHNENLSRRLLTFSAQAPISS